MGDGNVDSPSHECGESGSSVPMERLNLELKLGAGPFDGHEQITQEDDIRTIDRDALAEIYKYKELAEARNEWDMFDLPDWTRFCSVINPCNLEAKAFNCNWMMAEWHKPFDSYFCLTKDWGRMVQEHPKYMRRLLGCCGVRLKTKAFTHALKSRGFKSRIYCNLQIPAGTDIVLKRFGQGTKSGSPSLTTRKWYAILFSRLTMERLSMERLSIERLSC